MSFNKKKDPIAITIPKFTLRKNTDGIFGKYNEPYIVSMAIDESGTANPQIDFNIMPFPKVRAGNSITMLGDGHLLYGPKNPGEYVALSVLIMESDSDLRNLGKDVEKIVSSKAVDLGIKAVVAANPGSAAILGILKELTQLVSGQLKNNKDDELFRVEGTFLRDHSVPYHVNRVYEGLGNEFIDLSLQVIPLTQSNGEGPSTKSISIK